MLLSLYLRELSAAIVIEFMEIELSLHYNYAILIELVFGNRYGIIIADNFISDIL